MMNYKDWETLNESICTGYTLGLANPASLGLVGDNFQEARPPFIHDDDDDEDDDDYDGDVTDDEEDDGLEGDIMGGEEEDGIMGSEEGPESSFPPDGDMDDAEEEDDDGMGGILGDIDPELAGLEDDKIGPDGEIGGMGDELGPELTGDEMGDMDMGDMGDEMGDMDMGDMGDEMGGELGDEMGDMDMGGMGDEMGMMMPCPECNPDGEMEEGDPECQLCGGEGEIADEEGGDLDVDMAGDMEGEMGMDMEQDPEGEALAVSDLMHRMQDYMSRYMAPKMAAHMDAGGGGGTDFMAADNNQAAKYSKRPMAGRSTPSTPPHAKAKSFMDKDAHEKHMSYMKKKDKMKYMSADHKHMKHMKKMKHMQKMKHMEKDHMKHMKHMCAGSKCETFVGSDHETHAEFLANLTQSATSGLPQKGKSGLSEDALFQIVSPEEMSAPEPQAGGVGFAPQGRVGEIGSGYTQDDIADIPVLGEGKKGKYITLDQYIAKKAS